ncbi:hypothetical protein B0H11DRAFT_1939031 [Mycena galericulata]|nr:hypothetical protein B0H11DRAFT_1939031 [Mycena galericulata]
MTHPAAIIIPEYTGAIRRRASGNPTKSPNAFIIFRRDKIQQLKGTAGSPNHSATIAAMWKTLSPSDREQYEAQAQVERETHRLLYPDTIFQPQTFTPTSGQDYTTPKPILESTSARKPGRKPGRKPDSPNLRLQGVAQREYPRSHSSLTFSQSARQQGQPVHALGEDHGLYNDRVPHAACYYCPKHVHNQPPDKKLKDHQLSKYSSLSRWAG